MEANAAYTTTQSRLMKANAAYVNIPVKSKNDYDYVTVPNISVQVEDNATYSYVHHNSEAVKIATSYLHHCDWSKQERVVVKSKFGAARATPATMPSL